MQDTWPVLQVEGFKMELWPTHFFLVNQSSFLDNILSHKHTSPICHLGGMLPKHKPRLATQEGGSRECSEWSYLHYEIITWRYLGSQIPILPAQHTHSISHHRQTWLARKHVRVETGGRDDSWPFAKYKTAFSWQTTAVRQAGGTSPTRGLFLGEGEYDTWYLDLTSAAEKSTLL